MRKTKIICTIGPSSESPDIIRQLILSGMNVARLNFSHGDHAEHLRKIKLIRSVSEELNMPIAILQDLCGPKIRVGSVREPGIRLEPGQTFILTGNDVEGDERRASVSYPALPREVKIGDRILLADGMMELSVIAIADNDIICRVIIGGILTSHKGVNLPTGTIRADSLTEKDKADLLFGLEHDVDFVALSFVREARDILNTKQIITAQGKDTPVIAKIEKHEAIDNIDAIIAESDGIMVARGDLGVEIPLENVPGIQKMLVRKACLASKPVIIATQMLRSMVNSQRPTRAEATDVANAVLDGTDAIMLSEETANGDFPVEAVRFMVRIAESAEADFPHDRYLKLVPAKDISESVSHASCVLADHLDAAAIVATTRSGFTAMQISRFRPRPKLIALSPEKRTIRRLSLYWGCIPGFVPEPGNTDEHIEQTVLSAIGTGMVATGDLVVITTGHPLWAAGTTNMMRVKRL
jgi:pyruvate kinase